MGVAAGAGALSLKLPPAPGPFPRFIAFALQLLPSRFSLPFTHRGAAEVQNVVPNAHCAWLFNAMSTYCADNRANKVHVGMSLSIFAALS